MQIEKHDEKVLNNIIKQIKPKTPLDESKKIAIEFMDNCKFYVISDSDTEDQKKTNHFNKSKMLMTLSKVTNNTQLITILCELPLPKGRGFLLQYWFNQLLKTI